MKKELFKLLVAEFEKLGINPTKWLGTRTNVKRIGSQNLSTTPINELAIQREFDSKGVERILKLFEEEGRYLAQLTDAEGNQLLNNLKTVNKVVSPPPKPEADVHMFSELPGKKLTPEEFKGIQTDKENKIRSAMLKASMEVSGVDRKLAERLKLDMSKVSDWEKLQTWKDKHGVPDWAKEGESGIASLFKTVEDNPLADLGTQLDNIEKEGKSLVEQAEKLADLAWKMSPEGQAAEEAIRKDILRRGSEGKGFAGGVFGARNDGYYRAIVRPFLIAQHEKGIIKLADNTLESLRKSDDLKGGGDFMSADPVRVFRQHYGDDAFDLIPDQEVFGMGDTGYGPGRDRINEVLNKVIGKPILKVGPDNPGGYLTKGEYQAKLDHEDEVLGYINNKEGRFGNMTKEELLEEIAGVKKAKDSIKTARDIDYPPTGTTTDLNFDVIPGDSKKGKEIAEKLGITAKPGFPVTEAGKADLKTVVTEKGFTDPFPGKKSVLPSKEPLNIRLMKNFDQELTDEGLAKEGYNLSEITVLKNARNRMTTGEEMHPNEALLREKELLADEAGVEVDELKLAIDWGDMTPDNFATGGGVGSMFRRV